MKNQKDIATAVAALNALLFLIGMLLVAKFFPRPATGISLVIVLASILNLLAALRARRGERPRWNALSVLLNVCVSLLGVGMMFAKRHPQPLLAALLAFISLASIALILCARERQQTRQALSSAALRYEKYRENLMALGMGAVLFAGLEIKDLAEGNAPLGWLACTLPAAVVCGMLWVYFGRLAKKEKYAADLAALGMDGAEALSVAESEIASGRMGQAREKCWAGYYSRHAAEIDKLERDIKDILVTVHGLKPEINPVAPAAGVSHATMVHHEGLTAEQAARRIHEALVAGGHGSDPGIYTIPAKSTLSEKMSLVILCSAFGLAIYGDAVVFAGPGVEAFVPSAAWLDAGLWICAVLAPLYIAWLIWARKTGRVRDGRTFTASQYVLLAALGGPMIFALLWAGLVFGAGEIVTEVFGAPAARVFSVEKMDKTQRGRSSRPRRVAYCVEGGDIDGMLLNDEFCRLRAEHHAALPQDGPFPLILSGRQSPLGFVARGYFFPEIEAESGAPVPGMREFTVGIELLAGKNIPVDNEEGVKYIRAAAEKSHVEAQYLLGMMHAKGDNPAVPQDFGQARAWLEKAGAQGHAQARHYLDVMRRNGHGGP